jgi:WD40 repeat protein
VPGGQGGLVFSPDSTRLAATDFMGTNIWNVSTGNLIASFQGRARGGMGRATFSADGKRLACAGDGLGEKIPTRVWSLETKKAVATLETLHDHNIGIALSADGKMLASWGQLLLRRVPGGERNPGAVIQLWDVAAGKELRQLPLESYMPANAAFSPDGKQLAVVENGGTLVFWDVARCAIAERRSAISSAAGARLSARSPA